MSSNTYSASSTSIEPAQLPLIQEQSQRQYRQQPLQEQTQAQTQLQKQSQVDYKWSRCSQAQQAQQQHNQQQHNQQQQQNQQHQQPQQSHKMQHPKPYQHWSIFSGFAAILFLVLFASSCTPTKKILYLQDIKTNQNITNPHSYEAKIKKDDLLSILVSGLDKTVTAPFNLTVGDGVSTVSTDPTRSTLQYLVDANGFINFPMLGTLKVEGLTRAQLIDLLTQKLKQYVTDPIIVVQFMNYRVSVIGEVRNPGTFNLPSERTTLLQALGMAGDLTIQAKRENVLLIREVDGKQVYFAIDLRKSELLTSPAYFIQQNDVIYVSPSASSIASGTNFGSIWSIVLSSITTILTFIVITK